MLLCGSTTRAKLGTLWTSQVQRMIWPKILSSTSIKALRHFHSFAFFFCRGIGIKLNARLKPQCPMSARAQALTTPKPRWVQSSSDLSKALSPCYAWNPQHETLLQARDLTRDDCLEGGQTDQPSGNLSSEPKARLQLTTLVESAVPLRRSCYILHDVKS